MDELDVVTTKALTFADTLQISDAGDSSSLRFRFTARLAATADPAGLERARTRCLAGVTGEPPEVSALAAQLLEDAVLAWRK